MEHKRNKVKDTLVGLSVGDALGVPVEFRSRERLRQDPVVGMRAYGAWNQPAGTWSDDSSLTFCLADSLCNGYDLNDISSKFIAWYDNGYWGAHNEVFDVGNATRNSILRLKDGESPLFSGENEEHSNGNGSLMRILPLVFYLTDKTIEERYKLVKEVSSITHGHFRSVFSCFIYLEFALGLIEGLDKFDAYKSMKTKVNEYIDGKTFSTKEINLFSKILQNDIFLLEEPSIKSLGHVLDSLESSLWCLLNSSTYSETVLKAVNLGGDTDTTGAIAGGIAGLYYGIESIPDEWINTIARRDDILSLSERLNDRLGKGYN